jgi:hypothetical protein
MPQPDPAYPLTEFYLLLQHALDKAGRFALPALYARVLQKQVELGQWVGRVRLRHPEVRPRNMSSTHGEPP